MVGDRGGLGFSKRSTIQLITEGFKLAASSPREPAAPFRNYEIIGQYIHHRFTKVKAYISVISYELMSIHFYQFFFKVRDVASEEFIRVK